MIVHATHLKNFFIWHSHLHYTYSPSGNTCRSQTIVITSHQGLSNETKQKKISAAYAQSSKKSKVISSQPSCTDVGGGWSPCLFFLLNHLNLLITNKKRSYSTRSRLNKKKKKQNQPPPLLLSVRNVGTHVRLRNHPQISADVYI